MTDDDIKKYLRALSYGRFMYVDGYDPSVWLILDKLKHELIRTNKIHVEEFIEQHGGEYISDFNFHSNNSKGQLSFTKDRIKSINCQNERLRKEILVNCEKLHQNKLRLRWLSLGVMPRSILGNKTIIQAIKLYAKYVNQNNNRVVNEFLKQHHMSNQLHNVVSKYMILNNYAWSNCLDLGIAELMQSYQNQALRAMYSYYHHEISYNKINRYYCLASGTIYRLVNDSRAINV